MLGLRDMPDIDEQRLPAPVQAALAQMRQRIEQQAREIERRDVEIEHKATEIERKGREIAWRDARLEKLQIELARLNRWKFGVKTEAMTAQQRALFAETLVEDEGDGPLRAPSPPGVTRWCATNTRATGRCSIRWSTPAAKRRAAPPMPGASSRS